jgi:tetratricopeptide (TPR) repeat protein
MFIDQGPGGSRPDDPLQASGLAEDTGAMTSTDGQTLNHYRLLEMIGEGGMGTVYRAEDLKLQREVALKVLSGVFSHQEDSRLRFLREARSAAALNHPNVGTIYEVGEVETETEIHLAGHRLSVAAGTPFIAMELVRGQALGDLVRQKGPLPLDTLLDVAVQVAEGMAEAHAHKIVHRDLKLQNVMQAAGGRVKILDFGLAKPVEEGGGDPGGPSRVDTISAGLTGEGRILGTAAYMSPEQTLGKPLDSRSDIFSFGVMLYEMTAGQRPYRGESFTSVVAKILESEPEPLTRLRPEIPADLDRLIGRCLRKSPDERYGDTQDLVRDLRRLRDSLAAGGARGTGRGRGAAWALATAAIVVVTAAALWALVIRSPPPAPREAPVVTEDPIIQPAQAAVAVFPFTVRGTGEFDYLGEGLTDLLSTTLEWGGRLRSVDSRAVLGRVSRRGEELLGPDEASELARELGADRFILGDVVVAGDRLRVNASLYGTGPERNSQARASAEGDSSSLFSVVDDLTAQLLAAQFGGLDTRVIGIAAVTTDSVPALKAYLAGEAGLRAGRFGEALDAFQRAVQIDDSFALAYYRLSVAAEWLTRAELTRQAAEQAFQHSGRLADHDRLLLEAYLAWHRGASQEAERLYRAIVEAYPEDVEAWYQLGEVLFHYGPQRGNSVVASEPAFRTVLGFEADHALALFHQARIHAVRDEGRELDDLVSSVIDMSPESERRLSLLSLRAFTLGDEQEQERVLEMLRDASPGYGIEVSQAGWEVTLFAGDLAGSAAIYETLAGESNQREIQTFAQVVLAHVNVTQGRWRAARQHLERARRAGPASALEHQAYLSLLPFLPVPEGELQGLRRELVGMDAAAVPGSVSASLLVRVNNGVHPHIRAYLMGSLDARLGDPDGARTFSSELERLGEAPGGLFLGEDMARAVRARAAGQAGDVESALSELAAIRWETNYIYTLSSPFYSQAADRFFRARLLESEGRLEEALRLYACFEQYSVFDLVYAAPAHLRSAVILEQLEQRSRAAAHARRFLELWDGCDAELKSMYQEGETLLARLQD